MPSRTTAVTLGVIGACATIYYLTPSALYRYYDTAMATTDNLRIELSASEQASSRLHVKIQNSHPTCPVTFLTWDTPFDPSAINTGAIVVSEAETGEHIAGPGLKLNRLLPPPREDLVEIPAQGSVEKDIELAAIWLPNDGRAVTLHAEGEFRAVWARKKEDVNDENLMTFGGGGTIKGSFASSQDAKVILGGS